MRWQMGRRSDNVEDRRGIGVGGVAVGGGLGTIVLRGDRAVSRRGPAA